MPEIERFSAVVTITAASSAATTTPRIPFGRFAGGGVFIATTGGATQINWHASLTGEDTPVQIRAEGSAVTTAVTNGAHPFPDACFGFGYVAPVIVGGTSCAMTAFLKG